MSNLFFFNFVFLNEKMTSVVANSPAVFIFDLETNGSTFLPHILHAKHAILQIAIMAVGSKQSFNTLVSTEGVVIPVESSSIHNIFESDLNNKPGFKIAWKQILKFIYSNKQPRQEVVLCAHNCFGFDQSVLLKTLLQYNIDLPKGFHFFDSLVYFKARYPEREQLPFDERYNLNALHKAFCGKEITNAHDAFADVKALHDLLQAVGGFDGQICWSNFSSPCFTNTPLYSADSDITALRGIGEYYSKKFAAKLGKERLTIADLAHYTSQLSLPQIEDFVRSVCTYEKSVLHLCIKMYTLTRSLTLLEQIDVVNNFPLTQDLRTPFHRLLSAQSMRKCCDASLRGITHVALLDKYSYEDFEKILQPLCSFFEIMKLKNCYKNYL